MFLHWLWHRLFGHGWVFALLLVGLCLAVSPAHAVPLRLDCTPEAQAALPYVSIETRPAECIRKQHHVEPAYPEVTPGTPVPPPVAPAESDNFGLLLVISVVACSAFGLSRGAHHYLA
jgi:hypothetical protein